ncbi:MAG: DUF262 domain-containing protein [Acidobacteriota bacterium]
MRDYLQTTHRSVAWLKKAADDGSLEMRPPFQRNPVWLDPQKSYLIDTILHAYPIPELYMQEVVSQDGKETHIVVDGQQRIRACLEFIEGSFALSGDTPQFADMTFDELSPESKQRIYKYNFVVRVLPDMPEEELRSIFSRLNRNVVALNQQELRHATYWGDFIKLMESLAEEEFWSLSGLFTANDVRRMLDIEYISELAIGILHGPQEKKKTLDKWYEVYEQGFQEVPQVKQVFGSVLGEMAHMLPDISKYRWRKKSDFYSLFLVLSAHQEALPLARDQRDHARRLLIDFSNEINRFLADPEEAVSTDTKLYALAVERAATDLKNRRSRSMALEHVLADVWS